MISLVDTNSQMDRGFGAGAAWAWPYYSDEVRRITADRMESRAEFSRGVGFGVARVARHFIAAQKASILDRISSDPAFAEGFGEGTGNYLWSIYDEQQKQEFLDKTADSNEIARGLGAGIGFLHPYFKLGTFKDPEIRRGQGIGIKRAYKYLPEQARAQAFRMAEEDIEFATGFGQGIGTIYNYLENQEKSLTIAYIGENGFTKGIGIGVGSIFPYLGEQSRREILGYAAHIVQLSLGLGAGIGMHIQYLTKDLTLDMIESAKNNSHLAMGLGEGCGTIFPRLSQSTKNWLSSHVNIEGFAFGFGVGIGKIRKHTERHALEEAATLFTDSNKFYEGLAIGLGSTAAHLPREILAEVARSGSNTEFTMNFGFALGHIFSLLDAGKKKEVLEIMKDDEKFLAGLGEGAGHYLPVAGGQTLEEIMMYASSSSLATGTARGVIESFNYLNLAETIGILEYAGSHPEYGRILGEGLAEKFVSLGADKQSQILNALQKDSNFASAFAKAIPKSLVYMPAQSRDRIRSLIADLPHLADLIKEEQDSLMSQNARFAQFPIVGLVAGRGDWSVGAGEISFSGRVQNCCVCFIDMIGSTKISSELSPARLSKYYEFFLNPIALIARNFGAKIVKNAGDALIFYFDEAGDPKNIGKFKNVLDCGLTMGMASKTLNAKMLGENLPPVKYRVSAEYGQVSIARSKSSQSDDLFGPAMNICAKINPLARPNGLLIGQNLYEIVRELGEYVFAVEMNSSKGSYPAYHVDSEEHKDVINPFEKRALY